MLDFGFYNMDCMEGMRGFPDGYFDIAVVDPPYGINLFSKDFLSRSRYAPARDYKKYAGGGTCGHRSRSISANSRGFPKIRSYLGQIILWTPWRRDWGLHPHHVGSYGTKKTEAAVLRMRNWHTPHSKPPRGCFGLGGRECCRAI